MTLAWYNEIDPYCVAWLRNLISDNLIAPGVVDDRPIQDVRPFELAPFTQLHFFAGIGGWSRALRLAGIPDHRPLWTGSCPCQPFSAAGKRRGFADDRHLWPFWRYLIAVNRPAVVLGEQVARATDWLRLVRGDLEALGYAVGAIPVEAASAGADQLRDRFWFVARADSAVGIEQRSQSGGLPNGFANASLASSALADSAGESEREPQHANGAEPRSEPRPDAGGPVRINLGSSAGDGWKQGTQVLCGRESVVTAPSKTSEHMGLPGFAGAGWDSASSARPQAQGDREWRLAGSLGDASQSSGPSDDVGSADSRGWPPWESSFTPLSQGRAAQPAGGYEWVIGADGKARRVEPGVRLLAHAVPQRVAKLRAFGNAIVAPCAKEFIKAALIELDDGNA